MNRVKFLLFGVALLVLWAVAFADSPLTSTDFHQAYLDVAIVAKAKQAVTINEEIARYLASAKNPTDVKAAVINALSWNFNGKNNAQLYSRMIYQKPPAELKLDDLSGAELMVLGYLQAMDDYFQPQKALPFLEKAKIKKPKSFTIAIVHALVAAQAAMDTDWGEVWRVADRVLRDPTLTEEPLREAAKKIIVEYLVLYRN